MSECEHSKFAKETLSIKETSFILLHCCGIGRYNGSNRSFMLVKF